MNGCGSHFFCLLASVFVNVHGFNIDTRFPIIYRGTNNSYFGFTVQLNSNRNGSMALITALKGDYDSSSKTPQETGVLYTCRTFNSAACQEVPVIDPSEEETVVDNEETYHELKVNMSLGISLDVNSGSNGAVVTCGHLWKNKYYKEQYLANGACYVINNNLEKKSVKKLLPLIKKSLQSIGNPLIHNYYIGLAGFSAAFTEDGNNLILGAPGVYDGTGSLIDYKTPVENKHPYILRPQDLTSEKLNPDIYLGYSVSSGKLFEDGRTSYIAGAPRDGNDIGSVYVFQQFSFREPVIIQEHLVGEKVGEYFGYTVLGVNINSDSYTDILVGAPFYSTAKKGDEGRVYVYISDGTVLRKQQEILQGSKPMSRFGTAISNAGDLNLDGYTDIAIGAPYEDDVGAVYIYHGSAKGLKRNFIQKIVAKEFQMDITGFGFSIGKGKDIDSNNYPDLIIGAYSSNKAVLLRSRPLISVEASMDFNMKKIRFNSSDCEINGVNQTCFDFQYCLSYTGKFVDDSVSMDVTLETDNQQFMKPRTFFVDGISMERKSEIKTNVRLSRSRNNCFDRKVYVRKTVDDFISPVPFHLTYNVRDATSSEFCRNCPVLDGSVPNKITKQDTFQIECGDDDECLSDLKLNVSFVGLSDGAIIIGDNKPLIVEITIKNEGEAAYQSTVHIRMPQSIEIINSGECSIDYGDTMNISLSCNVGNPLSSQKLKSFQLKLDISKLSTNLTQLDFEFMANTTSTEVNPADNYAFKTVQFVSKASIRLKGSTDTEIVYLKDEMPERTITHKYIVSKSFPSPVHLVDITLSIPIKLAPNQETFFDVSNLTVEQMGEVTIYCNESEEDRKHIEGPHFRHLHAKDVSPNVYTSYDHPDHSEFDTTVIDCSTAICYTFQCTAGPFLHHEIAIFQIVGILNFQTLQKVVGKKDITVIKSEGLASIRDENIKHISNENEAFAEVSTVIEKPGLHKMMKIAYWVIILSVVIGVILLAAVIVLLMKVGFFRRKEKEEMDKMTESGHLLKRDEVHGAGEETE